MSDPKNAHTLHYLQGNILDGRFPPDVRLRKRLGRAVARLRYPYDALFGAGFTVGLWFTAALGAQVVLWSGGSLPGLAVGIPLVGVAVAAAAHTGSLMSRA